MTLLPTKKTEKKTDLRDFIVMLYGLPKIGKSTRCAAIDGALFIPTEPGLKSLSVYSTDMVTSWEHFLEICKEVATGKHDFKTIVIDTFDKLYQHCANHICTKKGVEHEGDIGFGKGISAIRNEVYRTITKLSSLETGLILVSHAQEIETADRVGGTVTRRAPSFSSYVWGNAAATAYHKAFVGEVDALLFATIAKNENGEATRVVKSKNTKDYEAGDRTGLFPDGMLLENLFKTGGKK